MKKSETIHHRRKRSDDIHLTPDVSYISNPDVAHEHTDVPVAPVAWFVAGLAVFGVAVALLMYGLFYYFDYREKSAEPPASPLARRGEERLPPEPRLQIAPGFGVRLEDGTWVNLEERPEPQSEYRVLSEQWGRELSGGYEWENQQAGTVRIPIEEAKRLYVAREQQKAAGQQQQQQQPQPGQQTQTPPQAGERIPATSSSGRTPEVRNQ
ncbi:MAG TPA: hypothetical protein VGV38_14210 [Pyrinomonadaceae bacterium]|nr:hypothetical protein [Pyrinomonadaceae bacterium]